MCCHLEHHRRVTAVLQVLLRDKMNVLLLLLPLAIVSHAVKWPAGVTFVLALLPLCSLAEVRRTSKDRLAPWPRALVLPQQHVSQCSCLLTTQLRGQGGEVQCVQSDSQPPLPRPVPVSMPCCCVCCLCLSAGAYRGWA